jgi:RNA polymerase sigma-70 factor (ECF subfamily)
MQSAAATGFDAGIAARPWSAAACADLGPTPRVHPIDLEAYRPALTRYARRALRDAADTQDVVQDTFYAAIQSPDAFVGRSSPKTWLFGILKHKIIDTYRRKLREVPVAELPGCESQDDIDALFASDGGWREPPASWGNPEAALEQSDFFEVLEGCIACLPVRTAAAFTLREVMELEVNEICDVLGISPNNCFVLLHRARMKLRALLEQHWFVPLASIRNRSRTRCPPRHKVAAPVFES